MPKSSDRGQSLRTLLDSIPDIAWLKDRESRFVAVNKPFALSCGLDDPDALVGKTDLDIWPAELAARYRADDLAVMASGSRKRVVEPLEGSATGRIWIETIKAPLMDPDGSVTGTVGIARDVSDRVMLEEELRRVNAELETRIMERTHTLSETIEALGAEVSERRRAEEALREQKQRLRSVIDAAPFGAHLYELIADGRLVFVGANRSADTILRVNHDQFIGKAIEVAFPALAQTEIPRLYGRIAAEGGVHEEVRVEYAEGEIRGVFDIRTVQTGPGQAAAFFQDVTDKQKAERERARLEAQFHEAQKMEAIGQLAGGVAHDFNNLLSVIISCAEFVLESLPSDSAQREDLLEIEKAAHRAAGLTRQMLAFSRKQVIEPRVISPNEAVANLAKMLNRLIGEQAALELKLASEVGDILMDPTQLDQIITNLVVNARDAMPGGGRISIETRNVVLGGAFTSQHPEVTPGDYVAMSVVDTGTGIPEEILPRIFEPFFTTKAPGKGTGLGLAMVYGAVKQNEGYVYATSKVGAGTSFTICFKRVPPNSPARDRATDAAALGGRGEVVLVVEDDESVRRALVRLIGAAGYRVVAAPNGAAALETFADGGDIDLVVTDVIMPDMGGQVLGDKLHAIRRDLPILYCSGYSGDMLSAQGVLKPGLKLIGKPIEKTVLLRAIRELLDDRPTASAGR